MDGPDQLDLHLSAMYLSPHEEHWLLLPLMGAEMLVFVILLSTFSITPVPIRTYSRLLPHTPAHACSLLHVLMHEYWRENGKCQNLLCT